MGLFDFLKTKKEQPQEPKKEPPRKYADASSIPEEERQFYQPDEYYTTNIGEGSPMAARVVTFEERKKTCIPSAHGLYVAEILLLSGCKHGAFPPDPGRIFNGSWWFKYGIRDVCGVLRSLVARGFIHMNDRGKYELTPLGEEELKENEYVPFMDTKRNTTTEGNMFGYEFNVWSINRLLDRFDKTGWEDVIKQEEAKKREDRIARIKANDDPKQKAILNDLAKMAEERGEKTEAFYFRNKALIDLFEFEISECLVARNNAKSEEEQLECLYNAKEKYEDYREWCNTKKIGKEYFEEHDRTGPERVSRYETILKDIAKAEYKLTIPQIILEKAQDGILQAELVKSFDLHPNEVRLIILKLEQDGRITREKSGRTFIIKTKKDI